MVDQEMRDNVLCNAAVLQVLVQRGLTGQLVLDTAKHHSDSRLVVLAAALIDDLDALARSQQALAEAAGSLENAAGELRRKTLAADLDEDVVSWVDTVHRSITEALQELSEVLTVAEESADSFLRQLQRSAYETRPCMCECNSGGHCGGCGHAGCGGRA